MTDAGTGPADAGPERDYLRAHAFLQDIAGARALGTALEIGAVDELCRSPGISSADLRRRLKIDRTALELLLALLAANRVVTVSDGACRLTRAFTAALAYRDLIEMLLAFCGRVLSDFSRGFTDLIVAPERFMNRAGIFDLFSYGRCRQLSSENIERTRQWMRITTCLSRYEAPVLAARHDFGRYPRILDVGGNSGETALAICRRHPRVRVTVLDLPVVCDLGKAHVHGKPEEKRIDFLPGDAVGGRLPAGYDLVLFKSMLHDWPDEAAAGLLAKAKDALVPGGAVLVFERRSWGPGADRLPYHLIPFLLFFRSYRSPAMYETMLDSLGFAAASVETVSLETPFVLLHAEKTPPAAGVP